MNKIYFYICLLSLQLVIFSSQDLSANSNEKILIDDMLIESNLIESFLNPHEIGSQGAGGFSVYRSQPWKNGVLPVSFGSTISSSQKKWFMKIAQKWTVSTGLSIVLRTNQTEYLYVKNNESGCFAEVGAQPGRIRTMNLEAACWTEAVVLHEIGHVLGLMHEHQRPDRNTFIRVEYENVDPNLSYAFDLFSTANMPTAYDFKSIMHYSQYAFSKNNKPTMTALPPYTKYQNTMGIKSISAQDRKAIQALYLDELKN